ncbi:hypothetical protein BT67DRAFT_149932 [Trichocladium antarcticum]|uniref:Uncharacterized protein n=1 Tax=Trichocladium antarcticum TaxID=1450529 RepID=A0AAN6UF29_9PEZI|nr:hypothetical protein BT67DRAFT_149932 [Trichocladium antarcticum]
MATAQTTLMLLGWPTPEDDRQTNPRARHGRRTHNSSTKNVIKHPAPQWQCCPRPSPSRPRPCPPQYPAATACGRVVWVVRTRSNHFSLRNTYPKRHDVIDKQKAPRPVSNTCNDQPSNHPLIHPNRASQPASQRHQPTRPTPPFTARCVAGPVGPPAETKHTDKPDATSCRGRDRTWVSRSYTGSSSVHSSNQSVSQSVRQAINQSMPTTTMPRITKKENPGARTAATTRNRQSTINSQSAACAIRKTRR